MYFQRKGRSIFRNRLPQLSQKSPKMRFRPLPANQTSNGVAWAFSVTSSPSDADRRHSTYIISGTSLQDLIPLRYGNLEVNAMVLCSSTQDNHWLANCGSKGNQIVKLFDAHAELFVLQFIGPLSQMVIKDVAMKTEAVRSSGRNAHFVIIDGQDTARLFYAYGHLSETIACILMPSCATRQYDTVVTAGFSGIRILRHGTLRRYRAFSLIPTECPCHRHDASESRACFAT